MKMEITTVVEDIAGKWRMQLIGYQQSIRSFHNSMQMLGGTVHANNMNVSPFPPGLYNHFHFYHPLIELSFGKGMILVHHKYDMTSNIGLKCFGEKTPFN